MSYSYCLASYVVMTSDLHTVDSVNKIMKYVDDTHPIIPASNVHTCATEIQYIEDWAVINNLMLCILLEFFATCSG